MDSRDCLAHYPFVVVRIACRVCARRGAYRLARLAAKFGPEISLRDLTDRFTYDCPLAGRGAVKEGQERVRRLSAGPRAEAPARYAARDGEDPARQEHVARRAVAIEELTRKCWLGVIHVTAFRPGCFKSHRALKITKGQSWCLRRGLQLRNEMKRPRESHAPSWPLAQALPGNLPGSSPSVQCPGVPIWPPSASAAHPIGQRRFATACEAMYEGLVEGLV